MPHFRATLKTVVTEHVIVEAKDINEARELIDDDDERVRVTEEIIGDFEIVHGSLVQTSKG